MFQCQAYRGLGKLSDTPKILERKRSYDSELLEWTWAMPPFPSRGNWSREAKEATHGHRAGPWGPPCPATSLKWDTVRMG